jgi:hypothetical protein
LVSLGIRFQGPTLTDANAADALWLVFWIAFLWTMPTTQELLARFRPALGYPGPLAARRDPPDVRSWLRWRPSPVWAVATASIATAALLHLTRVSEFLYFRF